MVKIKKSLQYIVPLLRYVHWHVQAQIKENIKVPRTSLAFVRGIHRWIPLTKGQYCGKCPFDDVIIGYLEHRKLIDISSDLEISLLTFCLQMAWQEQEPGYLQFIVPPLVFSHQLYWVIGFMLSNRFRFSFSKYLTVLTSASRYIFITNYNLTLDTNCHKNWLMYQQYGPILLANWVLLYCAIYLITQDSSYL